MASGSKKKNRNKKQQRKPQHHLPKVGTPADNAYLMKESRRDLVDFGMTSRRPGKATGVIIALVLIALALGVIGLLVFT